MASQGTLTYPARYQINPYYQPVSNTRLFYFVVSFFIVLQAVVVYLDIESRMFIGFCYLTLVLLFFFSLNKPELPIFAITLYVPFSKIIIGDLSTAINFTNVLLLITFFSWFISHESTEERFFARTPLNFPLLLFALMGLISLVQGSFLLEQVGGGNVIFSFWRWYVPMFLYVIVVNNIRDKESVKKCLVIIMIAAVVVALITIREHANIGNVSTWTKARIGGIAGNPNTLGTFFVNYGPLLLGVFIYNAHRIRSWFFMFLYLLCARGAHVTYSRGTWLAFATGTLFITILSKSKKLIIPGILLVGLIIINPSVLPESIEGRFRSTFTREQSYLEQSVEEKVEKSASDRIIIWKGALNMIKQNPILGFGFGTFNYYIMDYSEIEIPRDAHNTYLRIASEMGLFALLVFLSLLVIVFLTTLWVFRHTKDPFFKGCSIGYLGGIVGLAVACMFGSRMNSLEIAGQFWIIAALMQRLKMIITQEMIDKNKERAQTNAQTA
ncbi:MAG: O-antigen ligase family protein [Candidatus Cloacimonetes bacterium]|nr:O-antigen ligase family protein [Candidatus Cloacimonadota bacterium]